MAMACLRLCEDDSQPARTDTRPDTLARLVALLRRPRHEQALLHYDSDEDVGFAIDDVMAVLASRIAKTPAADLDGVLAKLVLLSLAIERDFTDDATALVHGLIHDAHRLGARHVPFRELRRAGVP